MIRSKVVLFSAVLIIVACTFAVADCVVYCPDTGAPEFRGFWADTYHHGFFNATETTQMMSDVRYARANAIVVEMRQSGDRFHLMAGADPSVPVEPLDNSYGYGGSDALTDIINKAHDTSGGKQRIEVHAWFCIYKVFTADRSTLPSGHILKVHPDWVMSDNVGNTYYGNLSFADPGVPGVQDWTHKVIMDVVNRYDIDGVNLDYIRYPDSAWGYNPTSVARFEAYNTAFDPDITFSTWRRLQVTQFVRRLYSDIIAVKPWVKLTIDGVCWNPCESSFEDNSAYWDVFQDWKSWCTNHIIDAAIPMNYKDEPTYGSSYRCFVDNSIIWAGDRHLYAGQGNYMNTIHDSLAQLCYDRSAGADGMAMYSYWCTRDPSCTHDTDFYQHLRDCIFTSVVPTPDMPWKSNPTEGYLKGRVTDKHTGAVIENAFMYVSGTSAGYAYSDGNGYYAHMKGIGPGTRNVIAQAPAVLGYPPRTYSNVLFTAGQVTTVDVQLDKNWPVISNVAASNVSYYSALINWNTDETSSSVVEYGTTTSYGSTASVLGYVTNHTVPLTGLLPAQLYHYRVKSVDEVNHETYSGDYTFTTLPDKAIVSQSFGTGWNLMSVPLDPVNSTPASVFAGIPINDNVYRYTPGCCYVAYEDANPGPFGNIKLGDGYWLYLSSPATVSYQGWLSIGTVAVPLATANWYLIGEPQHGDQLLANCSVRDTLTSEVKAFSAAATAGWISITLYYYDPTAGGYKTCGLDPWENDSYLRAWKGYWLQTLRANLELQVPKP